MHLSRRLRFGLIEKTSSFLFVLFVPFVGLFDLLRFGPIEKTSSFLFVLFVPFVGLSVLLRRTNLISLVTLSILCVGASAGPDELFDKGVKAYAAGEYANALGAFRASAGKSPSTGALQNLGNAEWQLGHTGHAVLAWERSLWLDAYNQAARQNLKFARWTAQLESPDLSWYEAISTWLPVNWWPWLAGVTLWGSIWIVVMPAILRRGQSWNQAAAAFGLMVFLLSLPALLGVSTRSKLGFVLERDTPLLLTPTRDGQALTHLAAGTPARLERFRGNFALVRVGRSRGWIEQSRFGLVCLENHASQSHTAARDSCYSCYSWAPCQNHPSQSHTAARDSCYSCYSWAFSFSCGLGSVAPAFSAFSVVKFPLCGARPGLRPSKKRLHFYSCYSCYSWAFSFSCGLGPLVPRRRKELNPVAKTAIKRGT